MIKNSLIFFQTNYFNYKRFSKYRRLKNKNLFLILLNTSFLVSCYLKFKLIIYIHYTNITSLIINLKLVKKWLYFDLGQNSLIKSEYLILSLIIPFIKLVLKVVLELVYYPVLKQNKFNLKFNSILTIQNALYWRTF